MKTCRGVLFGLLFALGGFWLPLVAILIAQEKPHAEATPAVALSEVQKLQVQIALKTIETWQLKAYQAVTESEKARAALQQLVAAITPVGYVLNEQLDLVKVPSPVKTDTPATKPQ